MRACNSIQGPPDSCAKPFTVVCTCGLLLRRQKQAGPWAEPSLTGELKSQKKKKHQQIKTNTPGWTVPKDEKVKLSSCPWHVRIYTAFYIQNTYTHLYLISLPQDDYRSLLCGILRCFCQVSLCLRQQDALRKAFVFPELPLRSYKYHHPAESLKKTKPFRGTKALTGCVDERGNYRTEGPKREEKGARHAVQYRCRGSNKAPNPPGIH